MMIRMGMQELVAGDEHEYVEIAAELLQNLSGLRELRTQIRHGFHNSPFTDISGLVRELEATMTGWATGRLAPFTMLETRRTC
ncbi:hypothetical protein CA13_37130 [Planctomycetes bacterium CA13]|uniref:O-GlcNAc transferase C-terminal domain-containing protein n=2 Tax=Novipirellula herctigrandis TaxID=2527986 RepID=A0A5C5Z600_9BACT|nr:hypothetical protein CA13_37130 [Planctomycetes bacterium CA13]